MDRQAFVLGHILHRFGQFKFSMKDFDDRLRLQKFIYLLQAHGIYLGYDFSWYLRGPYCTSLATAGFILDEFYEMMPAKRANKSEGFVNGIIRDRFKNFTNLVKGRETDANFLEAAASLHFLLETRKADSHAEAVDIVFRKMERGYAYSKTLQRDRVDREYIEDVLRKLERVGLVRDAAGASPAERWVKPVQLDLEAGPPKQVMPADLPRDMGVRDVDKAVYYMLHDAAIVGESDVELVGKNVFRPGEKRPVADDYVMNDDVVFDIRRRHGIGVPANTRT